MGPFRRDWPVFTRLGGGLSNPAWLKPLGQQRHPHHRHHSRHTHQPETRAHLDRRIAEGKTKREALRALKRHISCDIFRRLNEIALTSEEASLTGVSVHPTHDRPCQASQGRFRSRVTAATTRRPSARRPIHRYRIGGGAGSVLASFPGPTAHAITHGAISSAYLPIAVCDFRRANARLA